MDCTTRNEGKGNRRAVKEERSPNDVKVIRRTTLLFEKAKREEKGEKELRMK